MKNNITKNFTITPNALINDESINPIARFLFVWLCSKPEGWKFHNSVIEKSMGFGKDSRLKYMNELKNKGWISTFQVVKNDGTFGENEIQLNPQPIKPATDEPQPELSAAEKIRSGKNPPLNDTDLFSNNNTNSKKDLSVKKQIEIRDSKEVIKYLNEKRDSKRGFKFTSANLKPIKARIKEGFKIEDFKKVIDFKIHEWSENDKMKKYIRPETLFGSKFNGYLIESEDFKPTGDGSNNFEYKPQEKADLL